MDRSDVEPNPLAFRSKSRRPPRYYGMHRSGTSMLAGLHSCGVFLGPEDELSRDAA